MQWLLQATQYLMEWRTCSGARDVARSGAPEGGSAGSWELVFHKGQSQVAKPQAAAICAGALQLCALCPRCAQPRLQLLPLPAWLRSVIAAEV